MQHEAAKPKGAVQADNAPQQEPMRGSASAIRRNPSTDQKKVRRQMAKKADFEDLFPMSKISVKTNCINCNDPMIVPENVSFPECPNCQDRRKRDVAADQDKSFFDQTKASRKTAGTMDPVECTKCGWSGNALLGHDPDNDSCPMGCGKTVVLKSNKEASRKTAGLAHYPADVNDAFDHLTKVHGQDPGEVLNEIYEHGYDTGINDVYPNKPSDNSPGDALKAHHSGLHSIIDGGYDEHFHHDEENPVLEVDHSLGGYDDGDQYNSEFKPQSSRKTAGPAAPLLALIPELLGGAAVAGEAAGAAGLAAGAGGAAAGAGGLAAGELAGGAAAGSGMAAAGEGAAARGFGQQAKDWAMDKGKGYVKDKVQQSAKDAFSPQQNNQNQQQPDSVSAIGQPLQIQPTSAAMHIALAEYNASVSALFKATAVENFDPLKLNFNYSYERHLDENGGAHNDGKCTPPCQHYGYHRITAHHGRDPLPVGEIHWAEESSDWASPGEVENVRVNRDLRNRGLANRLFNAATAAWRDGRAEHRPYLPSSQFNPSLFEEEGLEPEHFPKANELEQVFGEDSSNEGFPEFHQRRGTTASRRTAAPADITCRSCDATGKTKNGKNACGNCGGMGIVPAEVNAPKTAIWGTPEGGSDILQGLIYGVPAGLFALDQGMRRVVHPVMDNIERKKDQKRKKQRLQEEEEANNQNSANQDPREASRKTATQYDTRADKLNPGDQVRTPTGQTTKVVRVRNHESSGKHVYVDTEAGTTIVPREDSFEIVPQNARQQELPGYGTPGGTSNKLPFDPHGPGGTNVAPDSVCPVCGSKGTLRRTGDHYTCSKCGYQENFGGASDKNYSSSTQVIKTFTQKNNRHTASAIANRARQVLNQEENQ